MKNTIINLLESQSKVHFAGYNYEKSFIEMEDENEIYRVPVIHRYKANSWYDEPREIFWETGKKKIDGIIWKWYDRKERRWRNGSPNES